MYLKYGSNVRPLNEAGVMQSKQAQPGPRGVPPFIHEIWQIRGTLIADNQTDLETAMTELMEAYSVDMQDIALLNDDGVTPTPMAMANADTITGIRISAPVFFPQYQGAEGSIIRTYNITAEWQTVNPDPLAVVQDLTEQITFSGTGGPRVIYQPTLNGPPIAQQIQAVTTQHIYQTGRAVGLLSTPTQNQPLYPQYEHVDERQIVPYRPVEMGNGAANWPITWSYHFEYVPSSGGSSLYGGAVTAVF